VFDCRRCQPIWSPSRESSPLDSPSGARISRGSPTWRMSREQQGVERLVEGVGNLEAGRAYSKETDVIWSSIASRGSPMDRFVSQVDSGLRHKWRIGQRARSSTTSLRGHQNVSSLHGIRENLPILPVHEDDSLGIAGLDEPNQVIMAGVRTEVELLPFTLDVDRDPVQVDDPLVDEASTVRPLDLVPGQEDGAPRILADLLQVSEDGPAIEHAARRHDHLALDRLLRVPRTAHDADAVHRLPQRLHGPDVLRVLDVDRVHLLAHAIEPDLVMRL